MIAKKETRAGRMNRYGFLYKKQYHTIRMAHADRIPGCFYYEWIADQDAIYAVQPVLWKMNGESIFGIGIDPVYACSQDMTELGRFFQCMEKMNSFEERRTYYERNGLTALYPQKVHPLVEQVIAQIQRTGGRESVEQIACRMQYSPRQIEYMFRQQFGYGPKRYGQFLRLHEAAAAMRENMNVTLAQIAYETGYSDPSHMLREFKRFIGMTPKAFREGYI